MKNSRMIKISNVCRVGDVLESINGINMSNADHRDAVRIVKESKRTLSIVSSNTMT